MIDLYPPLKFKIIQILNEVDRQRLPRVGMFCGLRAFEEQAKLYALGRTEKNADGVTAERPMGQIVTNADAGQSWHNYGIAADLVFKPGGHGNWSWSPMLPWDVLGAIGEKFGLEWGGRWHFKDTPHFQIKHDLTLEAAKKIYEDKGLEGVWEEIGK